VAASQTKNQKPVCVPAVIGVLAVWISNKKGKKNPRIYFKKSPPGACDKKKQFS